MFYTYLLFSAKFHKTYIGSTSNLSGRLSAHNHESNKGYTKRFQPWGIIYFEEFNTKAEAEQREKYFKTGTSREFLKQFIPKK
jgi:putative endonuclease